jgi:GDP-L-fucose synthase
MTAPRTETPPPAPKVYDLAGKRVWVAGHRGMVGSAIMRRLARSDCEILAVERRALDLTRQAEVERHMALARPDAVILAAAKVGGIVANAADPVGFLYENLMISANVIRAAHETGVARLLYLGSSCIYPRLAPQPIEEEALLTGALEPTNEGYALAKIAGLRLAQYYRRQHGAGFVTVMPTNIYGPGDNYDPTASHVIPGLIRRIDDARRAGAPQVVIWGTGRPRREFLHCDDVADACIHVLERHDGEAHVNVGAGVDIAIGELARLIAETVGYGGDLVFDAAKPDGTPRKLLDCSRLAALGWRPRIGLREGLAATVRHYRAHRDEARGVAPAA